MPALALSAEELGALRGRIEAALSEALGAKVAVRTLSPMAGGACQDLFDLTLDVRGETLRRVLRSDARSALPGSLDRKTEFAVLSLAVSRGVPAPPVAWPTADLVRPGAHAYFMDHVSGEAIGRKVVSSPELAAARLVLPAQWAAALARIHAIKPADAPSLSLSSWGERPSAEPARAVLASMRSQLTTLPEPHLAIELALGWLEDHVPECPEVTLVHGDFRVGNFLVGKEGLLAVLDWEFSHWGDPVEDLGWLCVRDWRFGRVDRPAGGVTTRKAILSAYADATGRAVAPEALHYWEVAGNVKWALGALYQGERYLSGQDRDLELLAIAKRAAEMEHEALRLLEVGAER